MAVNFVDMFKQNEQKQRPQTMIPEGEIDYKQRMAELLYSKASNTAPVQHWSQGATRLVDGFNASSKRQEATQAKEGNARLLQEQSVQQAQMMGGDASQQEFMQNNPGITKQLIAQKLASQGKAPPQTALMQNLAAAGLQPGSDEYKAAVLGGTKRGMTINNNLPGEQKGNEELHKMIGKQAGTYFERASSHQEIKQKYDKFAALVNDPNVRTGTLADAELSIKKFVSTVLGVDVKGLGAAEQAKKVTGELLGDIRKMIGDNRMSDSDRKAYERIIPNIGDSLEGIVLGLKIMNKTADASARNAEVYQNMIIKNGGVSLKVRRDFDKYLRETPILTIEDVKEAKAVASQTKQPLPGAGMTKSYQEFLKD